jgi:hypothetical protein
MQQGRMTLWVPVVGDGKTPETWYRPDLPNIAYSTNGGMPRDLTLDDAPVGVELCEVEIKTADLDTVRQHLIAQGHGVGPAAKVSFADKLLVRVAREVGGAQDESAAADTLFDSLSDESTPPQQKRALVQATARGVDPARAEAIRVRHDLPSASSTDGIDTELHTAAAQCVRRRLKRPMPAARQIVSDYLKNRRPQDVVRH